MIKPPLAATLIISVGLAVGACAPFANTVSDYWPTWAGGMPRDVPPRPGAPGYDEFLLRQQGKDVTPPAGPSGSAEAQVAPSATPVGTASAQAAVPASPPRNDQAAVQGGLY
jgi:hypothetical protein